MFCSLDVLMEMRHLVELLGLYIHTSRKEAEAPVMIDQGLIHTHEIQFLRKRTGERKKKLNQMSSVVSAKTLRNCTRHDA